MPDPSVLYCTDEDIKVRCSGDYDTLVPVDQVVASGIDGAILAGSWDLTSAGTDFEASGVAAGSVVRLTLSGSGSPTHFAVASVTGGTATLKRVGMTVGTGQPPVSTNTTGLKFVIETFQPQIESASYELNRRYGINDDFNGRSAKQLYDTRELRQACVLTVIARQYATECRTKDGDFANKLMLARTELTETLDRISVRFGTLGQGATPSNRFSATFRR